MWCLFAIVAQPDYSHPSVKTKIFFFETKEEANIKLKELKIWFITSYAYETILNKIEDNDNLLDEQLNILFDEVSDTFYENGYMGIDPFSCEIKEVIPGIEIGITGYW